MNYTPDELHNMDFKKTFMGYSEDQVNEVLDNVIEDYNEYTRKNKELDDKLTVLEQGVEHYRKMEESLENTLMVARQSGNEIKNNAREKADNIIKDAEIRAEKIIIDARGELARLQNEYEDLKKNINVFKSKAELSLSSQLELLKKMTKK